MCYDGVNWSWFNILFRHLRPGFTFTGLTGANDEDAEKPEGAWTPEEMVHYMLDKVREGEFYILAPDNETKREVDQLRIMWAAADIAEGRPALSRWHPNWTALYEEYIRDGLAQLEWARRNKETNKWWQNYAVTLYCMYVCITRKSVSMIFWLVHWKSFHMKGCELDGRRSIIYLIHVLLSSFGFM